MSKSAYGYVLSCVLAILIPMQLLAADAASAMLYTNGAAWLNGSAVPKSAAVFSGDLVQTQSDSTANISAAGSSVMVGSDSLVKFQGPTVAIEHGTVRVATSRGLATTAGEVTVKPAGNGWTEFQVTDVNGQVQIAASKGDLTIQDQQGTTTLAQGQQTTRDDTSQDEKKKKHRRNGTGAAPAAGGGIMSSTKAIIAGSVIVGGVTAWVLLQSDEPMSPSCRTNPCK
ncbi:MAG: hypothetical protein ACHP7J_02530 [Terriglobales bacterium]